MSLPVCPVRSQTVSLPWNSRDKSLLSPPCHLRLSTDRLSCRISASKKRCVVVWALSFIQRYRENQSISFICHPTPGGLHISICWNCLFCLSTKKTRVDHSLRFFRIITTSGRGVENTVIYVQKAVQTHSYADVGHWQNNIIQNLCEYMTTLILT